MRRKNWLSGTLAVGAGLLAAVLMWGAPGSQSLAEEGRRMPAFGETSAEAWVNSEPLTLADLKGQVVLLEVYTSG